MILDFCLHLILMSTVIFATLCISSIYIFRTACIDGVSICSVGIIYLVSGNAVREFCLVVPLSCFRGSYGSRTPQLVKLRRAVLW